MKIIQAFFIATSICMMQCSEIKNDRSPSVNDFLLLVNDSTDQFSYQNLRGEVVIAPGKYILCLTDTFRNHAMVMKANEGFMVIDRQEKALYEVFNYDNGPDYPSDGLFRIIQHGKIGYADAETYEIVIQPQFDCAFPFETGKAKVSNQCKTEKLGEHNSWTSDKWQYIDTKGKEIGAPKTD